jgi:hypothetical protein
VFPLDCLLQHQFIIAINFAIISRFGFILNKIPFK